MRKRLFASSPSIYLVSLFFFRLKKLLNRARVQRSCSMVQIPVVFAEAAVFVGPSDLRRQREEKRFENSSENSISFLLDFLRYFLLKSLHRFIRSLVLFNVMLFIARPATSCVNSITEIVKISDRGELAEERELEALLIVGR